MPPVIQRLSEDVINRIAAGEVVQRPSAALKELLENSLDAGATSIAVKLRDGGLQLLQVCDNGSGIDLADLPLVAERFATSKLREFSDLTKLCTFGFRGEAVASLSYVAMVSVVTRTKDSSMGYRCSYRDGKMMETQPSACACPQGTTLLVENMFYNYPTRRDSFAKSHDEHSRMVDVIQRYAIDNPKVSFTLAKADSATGDVNIPKSLSAKDTIACVFRQELRKHLVEVKGSHGTAGMRFEGYVSGPFYSAKRSVNILFVNRRLVECASIRRSCEQAFARVLPKNAHPFMYLSLMVRPDFLDVNVHPNKQEVHFLHEEDVVTTIHIALCDALAEAMRQQDVVNKLASQQQSQQPALQPIDYTGGGAGGQAVAPCHRDRSDSQRGALEKYLVKRTVHGPDPTETVDPSPSVPPLLPHILDRHTTQDDSRAVPAVTLEEASQVQNPRSALVVPECIDDEEDETQENKPNEAFIAFQKRKLQLEKGGPSHQRKREKQEEDEKPPVCPVATKKTKRIPIPEAELLTSVREELDSLKANAHAGLRAVMSACVYVGIVDARYCLVQQGTGLYLCDMVRITEALATQAVYVRWSRHERGVLSPPIPIPLLAQQRALAAHARMLKAYFEVTISSDGTLLESIPLLFPGYVPVAAHVVPFLAELTEAVSIPTEAECIRAVAVSLGKLSRFPGVIGPTCPSLEVLATVVQRVCVPMLRQFFQPSVSLAQGDGGGRGQGSAVQCIATTEALYRVFERC